MKTVEIKCDACGHDLTYTGNSVDYRLVLASEGKPIRPGIGVVTDMGIYPPVDRTHHFCRLDCLDKWRDEERAKDARRKRWYDENAIKNGRWTRWEKSCPDDSELLDLYGSTGGD